MMRITDFGKHLKEIRGQVSQKDFAKIIGVSQNHLSNLENGKREPTISLLLLLAEKKGIDISYWFSPDYGERPLSTETNAADICPSTNDRQRPVPKIQITDITHMSFPEIIALQAQIRVYLDNIKKPILDYDRRMLSDILAACQRAVDSNVIQTTIKAI